MNKRKPPKHLVPNPLLARDANPQWRAKKGKVGLKGGLFDYIRALNPGPPPLGWRDVTPYFGGMPQSLGHYKVRAEERGYILCMQTVFNEGQWYRRVAVALLHQRPVDAALNKDRKP
jgi:hypothetical protein